MRKVTFDEETFEKVKEHCPWRKDNLCRALSVLHGQTRIEGHCEKCQCAPLHFLGISFIPHMNFPADKNNESGVNIQ